MMMAAYRSLPTIWRKCLVGMCFFCRMNLSSCPIPSALNCGSLNSRSLPSKLSPSVSFHRLHLASPLSNFLIEAGFFSPTCPDAAAGGGGNNQWMVNIVALPRLHRDVPSCDSKPGNSYPRSMLPSGGDAHLGIVALVLALVPCSAPTGDFQKGVGISQTLDDVSAGLSHCTEVARGLRPAHL